MSRRAVRLWHLRATTCIAGALAKAAEGPAFENLGNTSGFVRSHAARHYESKASGKAERKWRCESIVNG